MAAEQQHVGLVMLPRQKSGPQKVKFSVSEGSPLWNLPKGQWHRLYLAPEETPAVEQKPAAPAEWPFPRNPRGVLVTHDQTKAPSDVDGEPPLRPMSTAPKDRTPVLLRFKTEIPGRADMTEAYARRWIVGSSRGDSMEWGLAGPFGCGGFPDDWFDGWLPAPAGGRTGGL